MLSVIYLSAVAVLAVLTALYGMGIHRLFGDLERPDSFELPGDKNLLHPLRVLFSLGTPFELNAVAGWAILVVVASSMPQPPAGGLGGGDCVAKFGRIALKGLCWEAIVLFTALTALYGLDVKRELAWRAHPGSFRLLCGNAITDPLGILLSFLAPLAAAGVAGLVFFWRRGRAGSWPMAMAALLFLVCTISLVTFGVYYFRGALGGSSRLSDNVWWMWPLGGWFGV